jgi:hypothetical protein
VCGGMGGVFLWVAIFPADVIKSRVQIQTTKLGEKKLSFIQMLSTIRKNEGILELLLSTFACICCNRSSTNISDLLVTL